MAYAGWNPVGWGFIADVHGRYFLPLATVAMLSIGARRFLPRSGPWWVAAFCICILATSLWEVLGRYYAR
jgi:hypothetical protein